MSTHLRSASPYRDEPHVAIEKARRLECENARLRSTVTGLIVVALLLGAAAAWWFGMLWSVHAPISPTAF